MPQINSRVQKITREEYLGLKPKKSKFRNVKTIIDGIKFDSKLESEFYSYIKNRKDIELVRCQPTVTLQAKEGKTRAITYKPDFEIIYNNKTIMVDAKGVETPVFKIKMNLYKRTNSPLLIIAKSIEKFKQKLNNI
jgi:Protein of unknown function (DUF1064)